MNKLKVSVNNVARTMVHKMVQKEMLGWPPHCTTSYFQPKRPAAIYKSEEKR